MYAACLTVLPVAPAVTAAAAAARPENQNLRRQRNNKEDSLTGILFSYKIRSL